MKLRDMLPISPFYSLKARISLTFAILAMFIAVLLSLVVGDLSERMLEQEIGSSLTVIAGDIAHSLDRFVVERFQDIISLADQQIIRNTRVANVAKLQIIEALQNAQTDFVWIGLLNQSGQVLTATDNIWIGENLSQMTWFQNAFNGPYFGGLQEEPRLETFIQNASSGPLQVIAVSAPIRDLNGTVLGVIGAYLSHDWMQQVGDIIRDYNEAGRSVQGFIINEDTSVLVDFTGQYDGQTRLDLKLIQQSNAEDTIHIAYDIEIWDDGLPYLTGYADTVTREDLPDLPWRTVVRQPISDAFKTAFDLERQILVAGVIMGAIFGVVGWYISHKIMHPLQEITVAADRIRLGDVSVNMPEGHGRNEIDVLSDSLNALIDELSKRSKQLRDLNSDLERRVEERTYNLKIRNEDLDAFAHTVAHDLKLPLSTILGYAELLQEIEKPNLSQDSKYYLQQIIVGGHRMNNITNELFLLAKLHQDDVITEPVNMSMILEEAIQRVELISQGANVTFDIMSNFPSAQGYAPWIIEVWTNYLTNAIKYGGTPPHIKIGYTLSENDPNIIYWVKDNGHGLSKDQQSILFKPFTRLSNLHIHGHGLGLSIVRRIIEKMGGTVGVESDPQKGGSCFYFILPKAQQELSSVQTTLETAP